MAHVKGTRNFVGGVYMAVSISAATLFPLTFIGEELPNSAQEFTGTPWGDSQIRASPEHPETSCEGLILRQC